MSSPSSLLLPENGDDWPIRMLVLVTPWAWAALPASKQASVPATAVNARIVVIAPPPRSRKIGRSNLGTLAYHGSSSPLDAAYRRFYTPPQGRRPTSPLLGEEFLDLLHPGLGAG